MKEEEGKERSSHRVSIRVYHSSMQCGVWPRPLKTRPERLYHSFLGGLMRTEAISAHVYRLSTMATFLYFIFTFSTLHILFTVTILSKNMNMSMDFLHSVCVFGFMYACVYSVWVDKRKRLDVAVRVCVYAPLSVCVCACDIYIKEFKAVFFSCADARGGAV